MLSEIFNGYHHHSMDIKTPHGAGKQITQYPCCLSAMYYNVTRITETLNIYIGCIIQTKKINKNCSLGCNFIIPPRYIDCGEFSQTYESNLNLYIYSLIMEQDINNGLENRCHLLVDIYMQLEIPYII